MNRGTRLFFDTILILLYAALILWWVNSGDRYRHKVFHLPPLTAEEKQMVRKAIKRHGDYRITREGEGIFIMHRDGGRIAL